MTLFLLQWSSPFYNFTTFDFPPPTALRRFRMYASYIQPHVLLWNPLEQFQNVQLACLHEHCSLIPLSLKCWKMGQTHSLQPRLIHNTEYTVLLVSALYMCPVGHEVSSTDPRIMKLVGEHNVPFVLLHKTGCTKNFEETVFELIKQGMTLRSIERFLEQMRQHHATSVAIQLHTALKSEYNGKCQPNLLNLIETCEALRLTKEPLPSNDMIAKCFIVNFMRNKDIYDLLMSQSC